MKTLKTLLLCGTLGLATLLVGCQTVRSDTTPTSALMCNKCRTVYFKAPNFMGAGSKGYTGLTDSSRMVCPECETIVSSWAKGNQVIKHQCKTCGGTISHCKAH